MLVIGEKEVNEGTVAVRSRKNGDMGAIDADKFISDALVEIAERRL